ncbi:MAG: hypothetical protein J2P22_08485 [Nocardioides sp.]|nr:hypothetical protein [Nocardioides sp.]
MSMRDDDPRDEGARASAEEQAWREIVDNYGERAELPGDPPDEPVEPVVEPEAEPFEPFHLELYDEKFTPPPLPPPPKISPERRVAWVGLVASPLLLVLLNLLHYALPGILTGGLVIAFIASFAYLVATMEPRDPDDDGARV